ncbi:transglutaminase-like cysteine peptidase [soil metagenome]
MLLRSVSTFAIVAGLLSMSVGAQAAEPPEASRFGVASRERFAEAPAPVGLIDFCRRQPQQCRTPGQSEIALERDVAEARQTYWRQVFASRGVASSGPSAIDRRAPRRSTRSSGQIETLDLGIAAEARIAVGGSQWALVETINRDINRSILQTDDQRQYAVSDYWNVPVARPGSRARGDCEDFVLAKRAALIARGVPGEALSIALVTTPWNEPHAVLLVASDRGDFVLDNLDERIFHWSRADLTWRSRQRPGDILKWIDLGGV